ncbi:MAG: DUF2207 domain-containing protein, partial [Armatimonadota bacterium]
MNRAIVTRCVLLIALLTCFAVPAWAKDFRLARAEITAEVRQDGSMRVREERDFVFNGDFTYAYRVLKLPPGTTVTRLAVGEPGTSYVERPDQSPGTYRVSRQGNALTVYWYYRASDETRTFVLAYDVAGAVQKHRDVAELYWQFIGTEWGAQTNFARVTVNLPGAVQRSDIRAWAHGPLWGNVAIADGRVDLTCKRLPAKTMVEGRILFPTHVILRSARQDKAAVLASVLAEEGRWAKSANRRRILFALPLILAIGGPLVALVLYLVFG